MYYCVLFALLLLSFVRYLQLLKIFVNEKLSAFCKFYETNKDFVDGLGKCAPKYTTSCMKPHKDIIIASS